MLTPHFDPQDLAQRAPYFFALWLITFAPPALLLNTTPKGSLLRWLWLPALLASSHALSVELFNATQMAVFKVMVAALSINAVQVALAMMTIEQPSPQDLVRGGVTLSSDSLIVKVFKTMGRFYNFRGVGTSWQITRVTPQPAYLQKRRGPDGKVSVASFLFRQGLIVAWQWLLMDFTFVMSITQPVEEAQALVGDDFEHRFRNLTPEQWQGRIIIGFLSWMVQARVCIDLWYRVASLVVLSLGLSTPEVWPPLFGSVADMYTLRGFWSNLWHQYLRWPLTTISSFITRRVLRLPAPSIFERYLNIFLVFFASGVSHLSLALYDPQALSDTYVYILVFFSSFAIGIMIEDAVQALWRHISGAGLRKSNAPVPLWHKIVGWAWVISCLALVTPWFVYPKVRLPPDTISFVPFLITPYVGMPAVGAVLGVSGPILLYCLGGEL